VDEDDYTPMLVENQDEYNLLQMSFRFREERSAARQGFVIDHFFYPSSDELGAAKW
jgi:hypothetical protein